MIGAGFMARGIAIQLANIFDGMIELAAICNRHIEKAVQVYATAGIDAPSICTAAEEVRMALNKRLPFVTTDPILIAEAEGIDVLLEVTGTIEAALPAVLRAIAAGKHIVLMNAELDGNARVLIEAQGRCCRGGIH